MKIYISKATLQILSSPPVPEKTMKQKKRSKRLFTLPLYRDCNLNHQMNTNITNQHFKTGMKRTIFLKQILTFFVETILFERLLHLKLTYIEQKKMYLTNHMFFKHNLHILDKNMIMPTQVT